MTTELRVTLPGPEGSADARRSLGVLERFLALLGQLEDAVLQKDSPNDRTAWGITDVRLGSLVTTLAPNRLASGASAITMKEVAGTAVTGLAEAEQHEGLPAGWTLKVANAAVELAKPLGLLAADGLMVELLQEGSPARVIHVTRQVAENLSTALRVRRQSIGSVIGTLDAITLHGQRRAGLWHERTNRRIEVTFTATQMDQVRAALGQRVEVSGRLIRAIDDELLSVKLRDLEILPSSPATDLIGLDPGFTNGADPVDYVREIRGAS
ncbi:hypothetical protein [Micromonospora rubida]|uniref:hypothetical protein n=1 Tax=Micromonospora rubida TaxID=2697657 RepID=UPI0013768615|nr:hypothetical protein [Micromonospora rubida]NBE80295.1 hypothetical protein [Micromonospora rubida]